MFKLRCKVAYVLLLLAKKIMPESRRTAQPFLSLRKAVDQIKNINH